jgi:hypothetical protein
MSLSKFKFILRPEKLVHRELVFWTFAKKRGDGSRPAENNEK